MVQGTSQRIHLTIPHMQLNGFFSFSMLKMILNSGILEKVDSLPLKDESIISRFHCIIFGDFIYSGLVKTFLPAQVCFQQTAERDTLVEIVI